MPRLVRTTALVLVCLALLAVPLVLHGYPLFILTLICNYVTVAVGLNVLCGSAGLVLVRACRVLLPSAPTGPPCLPPSSAGPFVVDFVLAAALAGAVGALVAIPALRSQETLAGDHHLRIRCRGADGHRGVPRRDGGRERAQRAGGRTAGVAERQPLSPQPRRGDRGDPDMRQPRAFEGRPRLGFDPRQRGGGERRRHQRHLLQGDGLHGQRGHRRDCRGAVWADHASTCRRTASTPPSRSPSSR